MINTSRYSVLFEMLRSFATLAHTLNLSKTVETLGTTRQTVRRHIRLLEELKGAVLLELRDQRYVLTEAGAACLTDADAVLANVDGWIAGSRVGGGETGGLSYETYSDGNGLDFHCQQHPLSRLSKDTAPLLQAGFRAWAEAGFKIDGPAMAKTRPYLVVYRKLRDDWFISAVGKQSAYAKWMGYEWAASAIGRSVGDSATGPEITKFVADAYDEVLALGNARLDHLFTQMPRGRDQLPKSNTYQRLLLACTYPDGSSAIATLVAISDRVDIPGLAPAKIPDLPQSLLQEYDPMSATLKNE
jgi:hypothetical protein